jgi:hypothetical protein
VSALVASADMTDERAGEAYEGEERLTVIGPKLNPSEIAPDFALDHFDGQRSRVSRWPTRTAPFAS